MTTLEYMKKQIDRHRRNYIIALDRGAPEQDTKNIALKITYYTEAVEALEHKEEK